ncbi:extracellular solute-binding protein [Aquibacillus saliphilus]|uniref:extracellular solute-binding protein n=1 Tax=Aquibacillus saliphilus TaxID=1909422 RepID=UPI001CEFB61D|nr:extracellular solute-binding protein [Aquibacillus saliphilus]
MKKVFLFLISIIAIAMLVGCADDTESTNDTENDSSDSKNDSKDSENQEESGKTVIRWVMKDESHSNPVSDAFFKRLEKGLKEDKDIDVDIQLVDVAAGNYAEKLNLLLSSGDIPDVIYFQGGDLNMSQQGILEDLTPYIEDSEYIKDSMFSHNMERMENYPYLLWIKPLSQKVPVVRGDWLEQTESGSTLLENPTVDNYYEFFKELTSLENGPKYALTAAGNIDEFNYIFDMAFGLNKTWLKNDQGELEYYRVSEQEKEKLAFYNKLYEEGLLDPQYVTKEWDTKEQSFYDNESGVIVGTAGKVIDIYNGKMTQVNGEEASLTVLPPAKGINQGFGATDVSKESRGVAISSHSEHKDIAFEILDYLASPEGQKLDRLGVEGEHYNVKDGEIEVTDKYYSEWFARFWEPSGFEPEMPLSKRLLSPPAQKSLELTEKYYEADNNFVVPEEFVSTWDATQNIYREFATDVIKGAVDIEEFDNYVEDWYAAGGDEITKHAKETIK